MKGMGDYIHSKGLKFGIYSSAGVWTCEGKAGSLNYEDVDAKDFASWGVDYLKYDNCFNEGVLAIIRYPAMRDALNKTGRPIFYSICNWGEENVGLWGNTTGNSWRTTPDILNSWFSLEYNFYGNGEYPESAGPGGWNDPDMLEIGNGGMTTDEERSHFALWSVIKAPLIIGCDLEKVSNTSLSILKSQLLIKVNQDALGQ
jgi:alpha-galactosidase